MYPVLKDGNGMGPTNAASVQQALLPAPLHVQLAALEPFLQLRAPPRAHPCELLFICAVSPKMTLLASRRVKKACEPGFFASEDGSVCLACDVCQDTTFVLAPCNATFNTVSTICSSEVGKA